MFNCFLVLKKLFLLFSIPWFPYWKFPQYLEWHYFPNFSPLLQLFLPLRCSCFSSGNRPLHCVMLWGFDTGGSMHCWEEVHIYQNELMHGIVNWLDSMIILMAFSNASGYLLLKVLRTDQFLQCFILILINYSPWLCVLECLMAVFSSIKTS